MTAIDQITRTVIVSIIAIVVFLLVCMFLMVRDYARRQQRREDVYEERLTDAGNERARATERAEAAYQEFSRQGLAMQDRYHAGMKAIVSEMADVTKEMKAMSIGVTKEMSTMSFSFRRALDHLPPPPRDSE